MKQNHVIVLGWALAAALVIGCTGGSAPTQPAGSSSVKELMTARQLTEADVEAALKTYTPGGKADEYMIFASGGHGGQVLAIGVPSMRMLKLIGVFAPEPWQGYGYGSKSGQEMFDQGKQNGKSITWADVHHPNLSETNGDYDGKYLFVNDKANARVAVIDLSDFMTKQIVANPLISSDHGGAFVDPNTTYIVETSQYPAPLGREYAAIGEYKDKYRGLAMFWKFNKEHGRIEPENSWAVELPPYTQDLADAGKLGSDGYVFINSFNTEMATGGVLEGKPPIESGASQNDMDYLHIINWKKAEQLVKAGKAKTIKGFKVLPLEVSGAEGVLTLVGEPKSPHGCDVTPDGTAVVVGGKLDTHATVYEFSKLKTLIEEKKFEGKDAYGVPILAFKDSIRGQVEIGLGPLHSVFDDKGNVYTSVFIESVVAKWSLKEMKLLEKLPVHYNIGHIMAAEGDTVSPDGKYVVAMNKMSMDRFSRVGPLLPQNFQLIDASGPKMKLIYDMPIAIGEPHYSQMIKMDKLKPVMKYAVGTNPYTEKLDPFRAEAGKERIDRKGTTVDVYMSLIRSHFTPDRIEVNEGDTVNLHLTSLEQADDQTHGFALNMYNINVSLEPGKHENITFVADKAGVYPMYCTEFCSALHLEMAGYFLVKPRLKTASAQ
ncbi:MAG: Sec-dependent nitrous-oxide reductase [Deltaproteobacteria bacterium]|nr:Sec-dependent nitrous-oxide reductase [Deltaproteobacteria bacterium]